jgi:hypothetical protein
VSGRFDLAALCVPNALTTKKFTSLKKKFEKKHKNKKKSLKLWWEQQCGARAVDEAGVTRALHCSATGAVHTNAVAAPSWELWQSRAAKQGMCLLVPVQVGTHIYRVDGSTLMSVA